MIADLYSGLETQGQTATGLKINISVTIRCRSSVQILRRPSESFACDACETDLADSDKSAVMLARQSEENKKKQRGRSSRPNFLV